MKKKVYWEHIYDKLSALYGERLAQSTVNELKPIAFQFQSRAREFQGYDNDIALITYADSINARSQKSLKVLINFYNRFSLANSIDIIHILPFYPWDTDRGFSVTDYYKVHEDYGTWNDTYEMSKKVRLMFDFVANHASIKNPLVQSSLITRHLSQKHREYKKHAKYKDFVIAYSVEDKPSKKDLKRLARPRPNPVLTKYYVEKINGIPKAKLGEPSISRARNAKILGSGWVWTTFSRPKNKKGGEETKQVDLNFQNPKVLIETIKILLFYVDKGASLIRLDAVGYLWKKLGSTSLHEKEAHLILEIIHDIMTIAAPDVITIAEVNEEQNKVLKYLGSGNGHTESDLVYQFAHFPLAVYAVLTGNPLPYKKWLRTIDVFKGRQFTTVFGSHDGMGLKPARGFLNEKQMDKLTDILVSTHKALPNYATLPGGKKIIYEVCATPWNLINPDGTKESIDMQINRYAAVLSLGLSIRGLPAIYINGLLGSSNYLPKKGLDENRTINRQVFNYDSLAKELSSGKTYLNKVFSYTNMLLRLRKNEDLFNASYPMPIIIDADNDSAIVLLLTNKDKSNHLISIVNVSANKENVIITVSNMKKVYKDLIAGKMYKSQGKVLKLKLLPYQTLWLK